MSIRVLFAVAAVVCAALVLAGADADTANLLAVGLICAAIATVVDR